MTVLCHCVTRESCPEYRRLAQSLRTCTREVVQLWAKIRTERGQGWGQHSAVFVSPARTWSRTQVTHTHTHTLTWLTEDDYSTATARLARQRGKMATLDTVCRSQQHDLGDDLSKRSTRRNRCPIVYTFATDSMLSLLHTRTARVLVTTGAV